MNIGYSLVMKGGHGKSTGGTPSHASHATPITGNYHVVHVCVHVGSYEYCFYSVGRGVSNSMMCCLWLTYEVKRDTLQHFAILSTRKFVGRNFFAVCTLIYLRDFVENQSCYWYSC